MVTQGIATVDGDVLQTRAPQRERRHVAPPTLLDVERLRSTATIDCPGDIQSVQQAIATQPGAEMRDAEAAQTRTGEPERFDFVARHDVKGNQRVARGERYASQTAALVKPKLLNTLFRQLDTTPDWTAAVVP